MDKAEKVVQTEIMKYVKLYGWYCIKIMKANENGVHDLIMCVDGKFISCEVKAEKFHKNPEKQASLWQMKQLERVKNANGLACVVATLEQFQELYEDLIEY